MPAELKVALRLQRVSREVETKQSSEVSEPGPFQHPRLDPPVRPPVGLLLDPRRNTPTRTRWAHLKHPVALRAAVLIGAKHFVPFHSLHGVRTDPCRHAGRHRLAWQGTYMHIHS